MVPSVFHLSEQESHPSNLPTMASILADQQLATIPKKSRRPLRAKKNPENEDNIMAGNACEPSPMGLPSVPIADKENPKQGVGNRKKSNSESLAVELQKMQEKLERLTLEKERAEGLLKERDALLKQKEEELEIRGKDQERLQIEVKKLQKLKDFKPNVALPTSTSGDKQDNKEDKAKKKKEKKPCSAYILWSKEQWNQVKIENPGAEFKEISNILGSKWKSLSTEEKKPYEDRCQADKQAYQQIVGKEKRENEAMKLLMEQQKQKIAMELLEQFIQFKQDGEKEAKKKGKEKDPLKPKRPLSAFFLYSNERRAALVPQNNVLEIAKIVGEEWKNMTEEDRAPYEKAANKEKERYSREMELYKQKKAEEAEDIRKEEEENTKVQKQEALQLLKKKEKTEKIIKKVKATHKKKKEEKEKRDTNKPKKPPTSFLLFSKEARKALMEENPGVNNSTLHALISVRWKELDEADKKIWNDKAAEDMEAYKKAMEEYKRTEAEGNKSLPPLISLNLPTKEVERVQRAPLNTI